MKELFDFVWNNWQIIVPVAIIIISEILPFIKNVQANGILQAIVNILKKLSQPKP